MDIDIEDILADLDRDATAVEYSDQSHVLPSDGNTTLMNSSFDATRHGHKDVIEITPERDYQSLIRLWRNERCAPELLPYPFLLMSRMLRRVQEQMEHIENLSMGFLQESSEAPSDGHSNNKLQLLCMEAELERVKFVIRSYLRCRLSKVDKYMLYLRQLQGDNNSAIPLNELLSSHELEYHERHSAILLKLLNESILKHMPPELQAINDTEGSVSMVDEPDWDNFVFIYVRGSPNDPFLDNNEEGKPCYTVSISDLNEDVELTIGGIYVMPYSVIRDLLRQEKVELI
ncbi:SLD5 (YDR489W) [Zygosaccharomyces parabailii]|nr:SLD5 (YDR489W) [Zygosaccharomyces parabailii]CDH12913.1 probable DNA replication complex GINS protein SLD5 [Zygosaccharomyces bailii ISA1307]